MAAGLAAIALAAMTGLATAFPLAVVVAAGPAGVALVFVTTVVVAITFVAAAAIAAPFAFAIVGVVVVVVTGVALFTAAAAFVFAAALLTGVAVVSLRAPSEAFAGAILGARASAAGNDQGGGKRGCQKSGDKRAGHAISFFGPGGTPRGAAQPDRFSG